MRPMLRFAAARAADLVLIPCRASVADLHAIGSSLDVCRVADVPAYVVLNEVPVQARAAMAQHGAAVAPAMLCQRIAHVHAFTAGLSVMEHQAQSKAAGELAALYRWSIGGNQ